jgi:hyperosmotically inducible protein
VSVADLQRNERRRYAVLPYPTLTTLSRDVSTCTGSSLESSAVDLRQKGICLIVRPPQFDAIRWCSRRVGVRREYLLCPIGMNSLPRTIKRISPGYLCIVAGRIGVHYDSIALFAARAAFDSDIPRVIPTWGMNMHFHKMLSIVAACAVLYRGSAFAQTSAAPAGVPAMTSSKATVRAQNRQTAYAVRKALVRTKELAVGDISVVAKGDAVSLLGTVADNSQVALAGKTAVAVPHVRSVSNYLNCSLSWWRLGLRMHTGAGTPELPG